MTEPEHPPYWAACKSMNLARLGMFLYDALQRRTEPSTPTDGSTQLSQQEFSDLVGLMEAKAEAQKEDTTLPACPVYDGPAAWRRSDRYFRGSWPQFIKEYRQLEFSTLPLGV